MCRNYLSCEGCPIYAEANSDCERWCFDHYEKAEELVRKWEDEHPIVTNADKFREVFGIRIEASYCHPGNAVVGDFIFQKYPTSELAEWLCSEYEPPKESE